MWPSIVRRWPMKKSQLFPVHAAYRGDLAAFVPRASRCVASGRTRHVVRLGPVREDDDDEDEDEKKDEAQGGAGTIDRAKGRSAKKSLPPPVLWTRN